MFVIKVLKKMNVISFNTINPRIVAFRASSMSTISVLSMSAEPKCICL